MKKFITALSVSAFLLIACGSNDDQSVDKKEDAEQGIEVDKGLIDVELTLPATFFEDMTEEELLTAAKENGYKEAKVNEDGSVYYKMSKSQHKELLTETEKGVVETVEELVNSEDFSSFKEISYNKDFTEFDIKVDRETLENSFDSFGLMGLSFVSMFYNAIDGQNIDELKIVMNMIDSVTDEAYNTIIWPDNWEDEESEETEAN